MEGHHWMANQCRQLLLRQRGRGDVPTKRSENSDFSSQKCNMKRRTIIVGQGHDQQEQRDIVRGYKGNIIHTTKYTLLTFIPINLFQQFHRAANLYFLFLILLNWVPVVEAFQKEITMIPLLIVLTVIAIKDALEDYKRYLSDKKINNNVVQVYCGKEKAYNDIRWKDVQVGDFVRLSCNDIIPADILLLYSSDLHGICYIETSNLDGETNLKQRKIVSGLPLQGEEFNPESFHSHIECENPNNDLGTFRGFMVHSSGARAGLDSNNLLLRSCTIRNTETVVGIVVYAGHETKAMMNNSGPRYKRSHLEKHLNIAILWCFLLLIIMCFTTALGHGLWLKQLKNAIFSVDDGLAPALAGFYTFWTMIIVLQVLIPISLYVSIEIVKLGQIYFIQNDLSLYNEHVDCSIQCRALNITENLGQIQYLFSDKTGTLTENNMVFRRCSIYGIEYPHEENGCRLEMYEAEKSEATDCSVTLKSASRSKSQSCRSLSCNCSSVYLHTLTAQSEEDEKLSNQVLPRTSAIHRQMTKEVVPDPELVKKLSWLCSATQPSGNVIVEKNSSLELTYITDFFLALGICNSVVVSSPTQPQYVAGEIQTSHKSLDERKQIFQCFPLFSGFLTQSPTQRRGSPCSLSLFTRRKTGVFTLSSLPSNTIEKLFVTQEGNVNLSREVDETNGDKMKDIFVSTNADSNGASDNAQEMRIEDVPSSGMDDELLYEAVSPDEAALVHAARSYCFTLRGRSADDLLIDLPGIGTLTVQLLHILPFDSNRKRMSVVVRHPLTGKVTVYTKGADSVIMDILETPKGAEQAWETYNHIKVQTQKHLDSYAREGLRTLCITKKVLGEKEYEVWLKRQLLAESSIDNREELLLDSAERLETNLTLLGTTGIVDRLQEGVPETIESLQRAGIKVWVLTGDKQETAVNIAYACKLIGPNDQILTVNCETKDDCAALLEDLKLEVQHSAGQMSKKTTSEDSGELSSNSNVGFILVIDGRTLDYALKDLSGCFLELSHSCKAVICCRSTPLQKSQVVQLIRDKLKVMTLAVGDGANDVSMIQVSDVGIGISGQEGIQAVMSSDFAISRFKHLSKLLLVHGHWCFSRLGNMMFYFIYKNVMFVNLLFWYQFFCGFSGSVMTNSWVLIFFNLFFTSVPPLIYGILDKDIPAEQLMQMPELYQAANASEAYAPFLFWMTVLDAFYQSLVCFFVPYFAYVGSDIGELSFGSPINASALLIILLLQVIESHTTTWIHVFVLVLSGGSYFGFVLIFSISCLNCSPPTNPLGVEMLQMSQPLFYIVCTLTTVTALMPRVVFRALHNTMHLSALMLTSYREKAESEKYHRRRQHKTLNVSMASRQPDCADNSA
ncbi:probable phospholipid-transporting ATPase VD isoform X3 [Syngnathoides biaculeatus]|uniref:probable phospholipid-transporting ATPase VD isoform X3 n=1 Tax=Syngnathoides biaculeatus TaxID=300417 RepID=UPI002ADE6CCA|nr:probable phospholipid-transporting ATPase VD isoform X3 [Syngnathoides biaculeatus]